MVDLLNMGPAIMQQVVQWRLLRRLVQRNCTIVLVILWFIKTVLVLGSNALARAFQTKKPVSSHLRRVFEFGVPALAGGPCINARKACSALRNVALR